MRRQARLESLEQRLVFAAAVSLDVTANDLDVANQPGPSLVPGAEIVWKYQVLNSGDQPIRSLELMDDVGTPNDPLDDLAIQPIVENSAGSQLPAFGDSLATIDNLAIAKFEVDPVRDFIYASDVTGNAVAIIDADSLQVTKTISLSSKPRGMALSRDAQTLFVVTYDDANSDGAIVRIDLDSQTTITPLELSDEPLDVAAGVDGTLYVLTTTTIRPIDGTTGASAGANLDVTVAGGELVISPTGHRLYYANYGVNSAQLVQFDLTAATPTVLWTSPQGALTGSNGQDLTITQDGRFVSYAAGNGQGGYRIAKFDTSDMSIAGNFVTGAFPREIAYSPDASVAYTVNASGLIDAWDSDSYFQQGTINVAGQARELTVSRDGEKLFAAFDDELRVYSTARSIPKNIGDANGNRLLDPQETWSYAATSLAQVGAVESTAVMSSITEDGLPFSAGSVSYYQGRSAAIELSTTLNDLPIDFNNPPKFRADSQVQWRHQIANQGTDSLTQVQLQQTDGSAIDLLPFYTSGDVNENQTLDSGETWQFDVSQAVMAGQQQPHFVAIATAQDDEQIQSETFAEYYGVVTNLQTTALVNGQPADGTTEIGFGDAVTIAYQLSNAGNQPLTNIQILDDAGTVRVDDDFAPILQSGDQNQDSVLDPGETWVYRSQTTSTIGAHSRVASVAGLDAFSESFSQSVAAAYVGVGSNLELSMDIVDVANQEDASLHPVGDMLRLRYVLRNSGTLPLDVPQLVDDNGTPDDLSDDVTPFRVSADVGADGLISPGEVWEYRQTISAEAGAHTHLAQVSAVAVDEQGSPLDGVSPAFSASSVSYFGVQSAIDWTAAVDAQVAKSSPANLLLNDTQAQWNYTLVNTGNVALGDITLSSESVEQVDVLPAVQSVPHSVESGLVARGTKLAEIPNSQINKFATHRSLPRLYATVGNQNAVVILDTATLELIDTVPVSSGPAGLALSGDGSKLYVASSTSQTITTLDTQTNEVVATLSIAQVPTDIEVGSDGRLYVLTLQALMQIDPLTGEAVGVPLPVTVSGGEIQISPDRETLYYGDGNFNPATFYQIDVSGQVPSVLWSSAQASRRGGNGLELSLNPDASLVAHVTAISPTDSIGGAEQGGRRIDLYQTSDMSEAGTLVVSTEFQLGAFPRELEFSPDGRLAYVADETGKITVFDLVTNAAIHSIAVEGQVTQMTIDPTGRFIFAALEDELVVLSTGRANLLINQGDVNFDGVLDPGEAWKYRSEETVNPGLTQRTVAVQTTDVLDQNLGQSASIAFIGSDLVSVDQLVAGAPVLTLNEPPTGVTVSDFRFELIGSQLSLQTNQYLEHDLDDQMELRLTSGEDDTLERLIVIDVGGSDYPWQNASITEDVNNSSSVTALDALLIINQLADGSTIELGVRPSTELSFYDVSGDNRISALDALLVINRLNGTGASGEANAASEPPEISSSVSDLNQLGGHDLINPNEEIAAKRKRDLLDQKMASLDEAFAMF